MVGRIGGVAYDFTVMIADDAPGRGSCFKRSVLNELTRRRVGRFNHTNVVEQDLAAVEQSEDELVPQGRALVSRRHPAVTVGFPSRLRRFVAGGPGLRAGVVGQWIA